MSTSAVDHLLATVCDPQQSFAEALSADVVLDATVPNWRFTVRGAQAVSRQLASWFADPATFDSLSRTELPGGELIRFQLRWSEHGVPHVCHQAHVVEVEDGLIVADTAWCGGRWDATLVAEMEAARAGR
ncbi:MAG TPA: hypothetical protein VNA14_04665 [Mycobacteriales bacterium]|nr:hypothetical protein [Mycobacteriales bacterium]